MVSSIEGKREYLCTACGGVVLTVAALRQLAAATAQHIWTEGPSQVNGTGQARCPFCSRTMQPKAVDVGAAAVCRPCEAVWLDKTAAAHVTVEREPAPGGPTLVSDALRCPECGAPLANSAQESCQYCGASLHVPTKVVVLPEGTPGDMGSGSGTGRLGMVGEVLGTILNGW